jgi:RNA 2',3'-cyclic 3'-phosphodiesterase
MAESKRLFFGMEIHAPWPDSFPKGRLLDANHRHLTLAFLGETDYGKLQESLKTFPQPNFKVGFAGQFDQCLFLPEKHPHVAAWHIKWLEDEKDLIEFQKTLVLWLQAKGFFPDTKHPFMAHVTLCRNPFQIKEWKNTFETLPAIASSIKLYESLGHAHYMSLWELSLAQPFTEIEHTADIAYQIRGTNYDQLFAHGALALAFNFPAILPFFSRKEGLLHIEEVIVALNQLVAYADQEIGCPFKAVSFHDTIQEENGVLHWEMIIDV